MEKSLALLMLIFFSRSSQVGCLKHIRSNTIFIATTDLFNDNMAIDSPNLTLFIGAIYIDAICKHSQHNNTLWIDDSPTKPTTSPHSLSFKLSFMIFNSNGGIN